MSLNWLFPSSVAKKGALRKVVVTEVVVAQAWWLYGGGVSVELG